jgi:hypothetical protein
MRWTPFLAALALASCSTARPPEGEVAVHRLTPTEYNATILDLYGFGPESFPSPEALWEHGYEEDDEEAGEVWPWSFPEELGHDGFEGFSEGQVPSSYLIEQYERAASAFAPFALIAPAFSTCGDFTELPDADAAACAWSSVGRFAQRAARRPLDTEEQARLKAFHDGNVAAWGVRDGTVLTVQGILQAPYFLYRPEFGASGDTAQPLSSWEMASRLSYFLWDSMPDGELFAAAAADQLKTRAQVEAQARRMLADPRARRMVRQFLETDKVLINRADERTYAAVYKPELLEAGTDLGGDNELWTAILIGVRRMMLEEADLFVDKTLFEGAGTYAALLTDNHGYVGYSSAGGFGFDFDLADLYGIGGDDFLAGEDVRFEFDDGNFGYQMWLRPATFPADQRAGILTLGAVLAGRAHPVHPAPVLRGVFLLERLLCQDLGQPPDAAAGTAPPDSLAAEATNRERLAATTTSVACAGCHERINPAGFAFENYDSLGGWRDTDNGRPVDSSGTLEVSGETFTFTNAVDLARGLAASPTAHQCYARHWTRYALGRVETSAERDRVRALTADFLDRDGGDVRELLVRIATDDLFRYRPAGGAQ